VSQPSKLSTPDGAGSHLAFGVGAGLLAVGAVLAALLFGRTKPAAVPEPTSISRTALEPEPLAS
jgi:hypothetical protein